MEEVMKITGLHLLLTYQCTFECDHCFVWGSPRQSGVMTLQDIRRILTQGQELGTVESIYFEGGEPFLYYAVLVQAVREAAQIGFSVGLVSNAYWATSLEDAIEWLKPMARLVQDFRLASFHATGAAAVHGTAATMPRYSDWIIARWPKALSMSMQSGRSRPATRRP
jgi:uncharacterized Fe-S radical SAM superfamily protein PflX